MLHMGKYIPPNPVSTQKLILQMDIILCQYLSFIFLQKKLSFPFAV